MKGKRLSKLFAHRVGHRSGDTRELAAQLAPLEELRESSEAGRTNASQLVAQENGAIVVGVEKNLASDVIEAEKRSGAWGLEPVVIVIVGLLLAFIVFIAWQVSRMPSPQ